jgi:AcrR family transcriptional regulator
MQDIVTEAGTSVGNAYFYFSNKEHVLLELVESAMQHLWKTAEEMTASVPLGPARVGTLIHLNVREAMSGELRMVRLVFVIEPHAGAVVAIRDFAVKKWIEVMATSFPRLSIPERQAAAAAIFGIIRGLVEAAIVNEPPIPAITVARSAVRWVLRGLGTADPEIDAIIKSAVRRARARSRLE